MDRREFLKKSGVISAGTFFVPMFLQNFQALGKLLNINDKRLVVIQLSGGNDGLNTIVPFANDIYYQKRPQLSLSSSEIVKVGHDELAFSFGLSALKNIFENGEMAIVNSVGYPNPDRSHFRSMDIWHTASDSDQYLQKGWLSRYLEQCSECESAHSALEFNNSLSLVLKGSKRNGFAMRNPKHLRRSMKSPIVQAVLNHQESHHPKADYLYKTLVNTASSADYLFEKSKIYKAKTEFPQSPVSRNLKQVAELIVSGNDSKIYYTEFAGFDTHVNQKVQHQNLLQKYSEAVSAFVKELKANDQWKNTVVLTFSEFGRRVAQNAGNGTDHGTASNVFLMSGSLKKAGFYNAASSLSDLDKGDLKYKIDFRQIYAEILQNVLSANPKSVLNKDFELLGIL